MELAQTLLTCAYMYINLIMWTPTTVLMFETVLKHADITLSHIMLLHLVLNVRAMRRQWWARWLRAIHILCRTNFGLTVIQGLM